MHFTHKLVFVIKKTREWHCAFEETLHQIEVKIEEDLATTMMEVMGISIIHIFNVIIVENKNIMNPMQDERFEMNK